MPMIQKFVSSPGADICLVIRVGFKLRLITRFLLDLSQRRGSSEILNGQLMLPVISRDHFSGLDVDVDNQELTPEIHNF
jgi:hypothetical protein